MTETENCKEDFHPPTSPPGVGIGSEELAYPNQRIKVPPGAGSVIELVRKGMQQYPKQGANAARLVGLNWRVFAFVRQLLILLDRPLSMSDRDAVITALTVVEKDRQFRPARRLVIKILDREFPSRRDRRELETPHVIKKRMLRYDKTLMHIRESCESTVDMEIPRGLKPHDVKEALTSLAVSVELLGRLMHRLIGDEKTE